jgi:hypothetical protein
VLGMKKKEWGKKLSEIPNFMFQNDKHYMISEIGGEKSSTNMVARLMDRTIGLGGIEELIKEISSSITKKRKNINEYSSRISELKSGMLNEDIIESMENQLSAIKKLEEKIYFLEEKRDLLNNALQIQKTLKIKKEELSNINTKIEKLEDVYNDCSSNYEKYKSLTLLLEKKNKIEQNHYELKSINDKLKVHDEIENIKQEVRDFWDLYKFSERFNKLKFDMSSNIKIHEELSKELEKQEKIFHDYKEEVGFCPVCGNKFC